MTTSMTEWADRDGAYWAAHDLRYDEMLAPLTKHLLPAAAIQPGERVLDVGCGCGNTTRLAAGAAADGPVLGVDLSEPMLERARQRAAEAGLRHVRFDRADAAVTPFEPVDLVMSQFGVMFFDDPVAAFTNLRAAGGRLAFLCWQEVERNENRMMKRKALGAHLSIPSLTPGGGMSFAEPARIREVLTAAGFSDIEIADVQEALPFGKDAASVTEFQLGDPTTQEWLAGASQEAAHRAAEALHEAYAARETPDGVFLDSAAWLVTAR